MQIKYKAFLKKILEKLQRNVWTNFRKMFGQILEKYLEKGERAFEVFWRTEDITQEPDVL